MHSIVSTNQVRHPLRGFTLVEMLVVIAIMSILMTAGAIGLGGLGGKGVTSGVATAESLFDEARSTAISKNLRACVLVAKKLDNNSADDLRRIIVAYEEIEKNASSPNYGAAKDPTSPTPSWELSSRGAVLPDQTFFSSTLSKRIHNDGNGTGAVDVISSSRFVSPVKSAFAGDYYIYIFNSQGILIDPNDDTYKGGASFIVGAGARNMSQSSTVQPPRVTAAGKRDFGGFVVWRNGRTSIFRSPDQMSGTKIQSFKSGDTF